jgi:hemoglobin-like flavoprotein
LQQSNKFSTRIKLLKTLLWRNLMTPKQITLVQTSFAQVTPIADTAAALFYQRLFELNPALRPLFKGDMREQGKKLMLMLKIVVSGLDRLEMIVPAVQELGRRHVVYGVQAAHYDTVGAALLWTLRQGLNETFTPDIEAAWAAAYTLLAETMKAAAAEVVPVNH